jgi:hypothetical protein
MRERRRNPRVRLSCYVLVRPLESGSEYFESIKLTDNSCRDGLSITTENALYCQRMRLVVTFPYSLHSCAINQDYIAEVVRRDVLPDGCYRIAIHFLTTAKLSTPPASGLRSSKVWDALWQRTSGDTRAGKLNGAGSTQRLSQVSEEWCGELQAANRKGNPNVGGAEIVTCRKDGKRILVELDRLLGDQNPSLIST